MSAPNGELRFGLHGGGWTLKFSSSSLQSLKQYQQRGWLSKESVGQLYSFDLTTDVVTVDKISVLRPKWSGAFGVKLDIRDANQERKCFFEQGLHCIGLWHSHPQACPEPSSQDVKLAANHAEAARPNLSGIVFVILGYASFPTGLGVWVHDGKAMIRMELV